MKIILPLLILLVLSNRTTIAVVKFNKKCTSNPEQNYLEKYIPTFENSQQDCVKCEDGSQQKTMPDKLTNHQHSSNFTKCIYYSQKNALNPSYTNINRWEKNTHYAFCPPDSTEPDFKTTIYRKPCITEKFNNFVSQSFLNTMKCIDINPYEIFPLINHESRFQVNIGNTNKVYGITQLTGIGVAQVNEVLNRTLDRKNRPTDRHNVKSLDLFFQSDRCTPIRDYLSHPFKVKKRMVKRTGRHKFWVDTCERVSFPDGVILNLLYGGLLYKHYKNRIKRFLKKENIKIKEGDKDKIFFDLVMYVYNGGPYHLMTSLETYIKLIIKEKQLDYKSFARNFPFFLKKHYGGEKITARKKKEVAEFATTIRREAREMVEKKEKDLKCSIF